MTAEAFTFGDMSVNTDESRSKPWMQLIVVGVPITQGSKYARVVRGRAIMTEGFGDKPRALKEWRSSIAAAARVWMESNGMPAPIEGPVILSATFYLPRPKSAPKRVIFPATKPDLSKCLRAIEDALSKIAYTDDARIVDFSPVRKRFAIASPPRVEIELRHATEADL
jgi:Holliday junction resolvase RusA-like endonuclease